LLKIRLEGVIGIRDRSTVAIGDLHTEPFRPARHGTADLAKAENANRLPLTLAASGRC
jgi:hypothetical protein